MEFINRVRANSESGMSLEDAVDKAVVSCIEDGIMEVFLRKHRAEVKDVILTEFDQKEYEKVIRDDAINEGKKRLKRKHQKATQPPF